MSPAATGVFEGDWRVAGVYRSQWRTVPVDYRTYSLSADWKAIQRGKSLLSLGLLLQNDQAGDANLSWTQGGLSISAAHTLGKSSAVSAGFGIAAAQRRVDISQLKFKNQWASDYFDPNLPSKETFGRSSGLAPTLSAGLNWHFKPAGSRGDQKKLPVRATFFSEGIYQFREMTDLVGFAAAQSMQSAREIVVGAGVRQILSEGLNNSSSIRFSLATRLNDAIIPAIQFERNNWLVGISYDWNISEFNEATQGRGGIEIAAVWRALSVPEVKTAKCCPVF